MTQLFVQAPERRLLEPYRRITSNGQFIPEIDGLRFIAIFLVFIYHLAGDVIRRSQANYALALKSNELFLVAQILNVGVPLFFVISGFILCLPFAQAHRGLRKPTPLKKYFWRRLTRLEPPYLLCLLLFFTLKIVAGKGSASDLLPNLFASMFYMHNQVFARPSDIDFVAWSLEIEIQFYILAPLLASVFGVARAFTRRVILVAGVVLASAISTLAWSHERMQLSLLGYAQYFLAGFILAEIYLSGGVERKSWRWDLVTIAGWSSLLFLLVRAGTISGWVAPWLIVLLYVATFRGPATNKLITNLWITTIGGMCYTIYLLHNYIIAGIGAVTEHIGNAMPFPLRLLLQFVLIAPCVLAVAAIYFRLIEKPCMVPNWPQHLKAALQGRTVHEEASRSLASAAR